MKKFLELFIKYKEIVMYLIMGFATTFISWVSYSIFTFVFSAFPDDTNVLLSSIVSWTIAVIFAYFTNKDLVFHSEAKTSKEKITQFLKFILGRAFTMVVEFVGGLILFTLPIPNIITKAGLTVIVIILNFFISKFFAFKSKKN